MTITYGAMGTAAAGLLLALASRVVLKQLGAGNSWFFNNAINSFLISLIISNRYQIILVLLYNEFIGYYSKRPLFRLPYARLLLLYIE